MSKYDLTLSNIRKGIDNPARAFDEVLLDYLLRFPTVMANGFHTIGTNVFDREWDVLILLDTCRVDALRTVSDEYEFIDEVNRIRSVGGGTAEWIARTFDEAHLDEIRKTAYLAANGHVQQILDARRQQNDIDMHLTYKVLRLMPTVDIEDVGKVEYLFKYEPWGEDGPLGHTEGMTPPRYVTDRAIAVGREGGFERLVLHYFQPHSPWVTNALEEDRALAAHERDWWGYLTETGDVESVWNAYLDDLRYVLDDVELLLDNLDAEKVVISSDHGEAFGEYGVMGHKIGSLHPKIRKVPWASTEGRDSGSYEPTVKEPNASKMAEEDLDRQLEALGYK